MKRFLPAILTLPLLLALIFNSSPVLAQTINSPDDESSDVDDATPVGRVARLTVIQGDVSFLRAGVTEWAPAVENLPLLAGDQIYTERGSRAEIQLARGNYIRLSERTELTITELSDSAAQLEITEGTAIIRIERLSSAFHRFEIDTPNSAVVLQKDGLYRVDVRGEHNSSLIVRRGGAEVSTDEGSFRVREGNRLLVDTSVGGRLELAADTTRDDWDEWSYDRDNTIASTNANVAPDYVNSYETTYNNFYGASDLSSYGTWTNYSSYGQCWIPRVSAGWAPYRSGQWIWIPAAGWTWLSNDPWGWAPYHYGRWAYLSGLGWAWIPGFGSQYPGYGYRDYYWRPALVSFFNCPTPRGHYVGWYPLAPGERWRRPDHGRGNDHAHLQYPSPRDGWRRPVDGKYGVRPPQSRHGVTILPVEGFARGDRSAGRPVSPGTELSGWINRGARPGLPDVKPAPIAARPALGENDQRKSRRIAVPPNEIIKRPVVTRNPNADSSASLGAPRERRLISPRNPETGTKGPALIDTGEERRAERRARRAAQSEGSQSGTVSGGDRTPPKVRLGLPTPSEKVDDSELGRKRTPQSDGAAERPPRKAEDSSDPTRAERRRARREQSDTPTPGESNTPEVRRRDSENPHREGRPPTRDSESHENARPRDRGESTPRAEGRHEQPHSENRDQTRQERRQEREQQREQPHSENRDQVRQERRQEREQQREQPRSENHEQARPERHQERQERQQQQEQRKRP